MKRYRIDELADIWEVSQKTIRRLIERGELEAIKVGSIWRISEFEVKRYEQDHSSKATA